MFHVSASKRCAVIEREREMREETETQRVGERDSGRHRETKRLGEGRE
jgi:hypothetical protein